MFTQPDGVAIIDTKANNKCVLIGMVSSYLPYTEVAISTQTGRPRMIFEENSGLGIVIPMEQIMQTIELSLRDAIENQGIQPPA